MAKEDLINKILSDAEAEAESIIAAAKKSAEETEAVARAQAETELEHAKEEADGRAKRISDGRAAAARLESSKIMLAEKRRVVDEIYARAHKKLLALGKRESVGLIEKLLESYAAEGDEILLAENFAYAADVSALPIVKAKKLKLSSERAPISGGIILKGASCDKDLSFKALLEADMDANVADIATRIFANQR